MSKMRTRYDISVENVDIKQGTKNDSRNCMVATAIGRTLKSVYGLDVGHIMADAQTVRFSLLNERKRLTYLTPMAVEAYVVAFDAGDPIEPFQFQLRNPAYVQAMSPSTWKPGEPAGRVDRSAKALIDTGHGIKEVPQVRIPRRVRREYGRRAMRINKERFFAEAGNASS